GSPFGAGTNPNSVAVGDFNRDGKPDLAVANRLSNNVTILLGDGAGGFSQAASSPVGAGSFPRYMAVGDFNGDDKPDLAVVIVGYHHVAILPGDGPRGLAQTARAPLVPGTKAWSVAG